MGSFTNALTIKILAGISALIIVVLNARLVFDFISKWIAEAGEGALIIWMTVVPCITAIFILLLYITLPKSWRRKQMARPVMKEELETVPKIYSAIGVAIDLGNLDVRVLSHAKLLAQQNNARVVLMHIVEGVGGQIFGTDAADDEARDDREHLAKHAEQLRTAGLEVQAVLGFGNIPKEIVRIANEQKIDLLVMGGHGHRGIKDIIFGTSISKVRHSLKVPVLVVQ